MQKVFNFIIIEHYSITRGHEARPRFMVWFCYFAPTGVGTRGVQYASRITLPKLFAKNLLPRHS